MKGDGRPYSFPKGLRLLKRPEFRRVYEEGRRESTRICTIFTRSNGLSKTRLGITTPSALGGAVVRNRIKRRLREVFRLNQARIPAGWDMVLNPRPKIATMPFESLTREMLRLFPAAPPKAPHGQGKAPGSPP
ncbi:MAG TPA: ribonuclease P protein component [Terriglobia bacterium]|nr:ribonuclease P protein component [Terriglobia bacterium]HVB28509.1 ribonuclease P protein component [Terriglobia bacterium]